MARDNHPMEKLTQPDDTNTNGDGVRLLFWNTWLLRPTLWPGGPAIPGGHRLFSAYPLERAPLVGQALVGRFDVVALAETFEPAEQSAVLSAWSGRPNVEVVRGPGRRPGRFAGSGLLTIVDGSQVRRSASHTYETGGSRLRDSDSWAVKGASMVEIDLGEGRPHLEIVSTHLFAGGDLFPLPGASDHRRHHRVRMEQVDELVSFLGSIHHPGNALLVVGDFNVPALDRRVPDQPTFRYDDLAGRLDGFGLEDLWVTHGVGDGATVAGGPTPKNKILDRRLPMDRSHPGAVEDLTPEPVDPAVPDPSGDRIDHLWYRAPDGGADGATLLPGRPRRYAFPSQVAGQQRQLSDHLAVGVELMLPTDRETRSDGPSVA